MDETTAVILTKLYVCPCCKFSVAWRQIDIYKYGWDFFCWNCDNYFADPLAIWVDENGVEVTE